MFFKPNTLFLRTPTPRSRRESPKADGNETPVFGSFTGVGSAAREREPQRWDERLAFPLGDKLESKKFKASWRNGVFEYWDAAAAAADTPAATVNATVEAERDLREATSGRAGGFGG